MSGSTLTGMVLELTAAELRRVAELLDAFGGSREWAEVHVWAERGVIRDDCVSDDPCHDCGAPPPNQRGNWGHYVIAGNNTIALCESCAERRFPPPAGEDGAA